MPVESGLLEREAERAALTAAAADARAGRGRLVIVEGEAGIGKTQLLGQLRDAAGLRVLTARGSDLESQVAFGVVRQLLEPVVRAGDPALLSGAAAQADRVFDPDAGGDPDSELAVLHGLFWLTANLCDQGPVAMIVDDLHWADTASLRFLAYLLPRVQAVPLLVLAGVRTGERTQDDLLMARLTADPEVLVLRPAPLSAAATEQLLATVLGPAEGEFVKAAYQATSGNPLLVRAVAGALHQAGVAPLDRHADQVLALGPRAVARLVALRLAAVSPETLAMARALAVLGQGARVETVRELAGLDPLSASEALAELVRMGLVEDPIGFVHPLVAAAVYAEIGVRDRAAAHTRAADLLDRAGAPAEQVGGHLLKVPPGSTEAAPRQLLRAARTALSRGSAEAGYAFLRRCLEEEPAQFEVLREAATVAIQVDLNAAAGLVEQARAQTSDPVERARLGLQLGIAHGYLLDPDRAYAALLAARDEVPPGEEELRRRIEATLLVGVFVVPGRTDIAARVPELAALPSHDSLGARMLSAVVGAHQMARCDPAGAGRARSALADGELVRSANGEGPLVCGWFTLLAADDPAGLASLDAAVAQAHQHGSTRALAAAYCFRAVGRLWTGQLLDADSDARAALDLASTGQVDMDPSFAAGYLAESLFLRGELDQAEAVLRSVGMPYPEPATRPRYYALDAWSRLLLLRGSYAESLAAARLAGEVWQVFGFDNPALGPWRSVAAQALYHLGDRSGAEQLVTEELALSRRWSAPRALGRSLRVLGTITGSVDLLRESVAILSASPARLERAAALLELGGALRRAGQRTESRDVLGRALDEAEICGATPLAARAVEELRVAGFRPRRHRVTGRDSLTASELRVAELAATGTPNREIAQSLFVTVKTVELHLSSTYRKLGISRRTDLPTALAS